MGYKQKHHEFWCPTNSCFQEAYDKVQMLCELQMPHGHETSAYHPPALPGHHESYRQEEDHLLENTGEKPGL